MSKAKSTIDDAFGQIVSYVQTDKGFLKRKEEKAESERKATKAYYRKAKAKYDAKHPDRVAARLALRQAVYQGEIERSDNCLFNNDDCRGEIEGHHWKGYAWENRLEVVWLCREHHLRVEHGGAALPDV